MKMLSQRRQGEILFIEVDQFEGNNTYREAPADGSRLIVGHSEAGHHHVIDLQRSPSAQLLIDEANDLAGRLILGEDAEVEHLRSFDTHAPLQLPAGKHIVRWRREYTPEGLRRVVD